MHYVLRWFGLIKVSKQWYIFPTFFFRVANKKEEWRRRKLGMLSKSTERNLSALTHFLQVYLNPLKCWLSLFYSHVQFCFVKYQKSMYVLRSTYSTKKILTPRKRNFMPELYLQYTLHKWLSALDHYFPLGDPTFCLNFPW